ncbi:TenA family protein [Vibrio zhugei]|uniref:TenA family protein n=1 Tax=Vibrio zhugei TaxID=2479546 RepID=A0ABV7C910_9VIBR|nr:TenA family protein [Vibrio zhugei]
MNDQDLIEACSQEWHDYINHTFVEQLAQGTLASSQYLHYLKQDFLFLKQRIRAYALAVYKSRTLHDMQLALPSIDSLLNEEMDHHVSYCAEWGIAASALEHEPEDVATIAYTRYVFDVGMAGDLVDLYVALAPCAIGYAVIGHERMNSGSTVLVANPYRRWIELYASESFQSEIAKQRHDLNHMLASIDIASERGQNLVEIFQTATRMEVAFWQQALEVK